MTLAILCSGQGAQHAGMFNLTGRLAVAEDLFAHAATWLGSDPRQWVQSTDEKALHVNRNAQLLCTLQALSAAAALAESLPRERCIAGYSVGEMAAWSVAGLIAAHDVLDLVIARADAMDHARHTAQGMIFIRGLNRSTLSQLLQDREAAIAIVNPGDAYVVAGTQAALEAVAADATRRGAAHVVPVAVDVASHTRLMREATATFGTPLSRVPTEREPSPGTRLISSIDAQVILNGPRNLDKLALQLSEPVQWTACLEACIEAGADTFLELGPGRALAAMVAAAYPGVNARSIDDFRSIDGVRAWLARVA
jgi:[acyl-carrier-protein] S-malonyltransferase